MDNPLFVNAMRGDLADIARLFGAAETLRERAHAGMEPQERAEYDSQLKQIQGQTERGLFMRAWEEGRALTLEQANTYALSSAEPP